MKAVTYFLELDDAASSLKVWLDHLTTDITYAIPVCITLINLLLVIYIGDKSSFYSKP